MDTCGQFHEHFTRIIQPKQNKACVITMQCFQNALAYLAAAVSYACKMFMKLTPVVLEGDEVVADLRPKLPVVGVMKLSVIARSST